MMDNNHFRHSFINIYCDLLNTVFQSDYLTNHLDSIANNIEEIIPAHRARWYNNGNWPNSAVNWQARINTMENFSNNRRSYAIAHIQNEFDLPNIAQITLNIIPEEAGSIQFNTLEIIESDWNGYYFPTVPIEAKAIPNEGFQFSTWLEFPDSNAAIHIQVTDPFTLTAVFMPTDLSPGTIVINEINYNSSDDFNPEDWIELHNPGETAVNISEWVLKDDDDGHVFSIPEATIIQPNEYLILAKDLNQFVSYFPNVNHTVGSFEFGLGGGGDQIRIYNTDGVLVDSLQYDDDDPWPTEADGNGPSLELINPALDNSLSESWAASTDNGTPGVLNSTYQVLKSDDVSLLPLSTTLLPAFPNPFNGSVTIPFQITRMNEASLNIYNLLGQKVTSFTLDGLAPGKHFIIWDGMNNLGKVSGTGIYLIHLQSASFSSVQKVIYLK